MGVRTSDYDTAAAIEGGLPPHALTHEAAGGDSIDVSGLYGQLVQPQVADRLVTANPASPITIQPSTPVAGQALIATSATQAGWANTVGVTGYGSVTALQVGGANANGTAATVSHSDHRHALPPFGNSTGNIMPGDQQCGGDLSGYVYNATVVQTRGFYGGIAGPVVLSGPPPSYGQTLQCIGTRAVQWKAQETGKWRLFLNSSGGAANQFETNIAYTFQPSGGPSATFTLPTQHVDGDQILVKFQGTPDGHQFIATEGQDTFDDFTTSITLVSTNEAYTFVVRANRWYRMAHFTTAQPPVRLFHVTNVTSPLPNTFVTITMPGSDQTVVLPADAVTGDVVVVKMSSTYPTGNIIVYPPGTQKIDGAASYTITGPWGSATFEASSGSGWAVTAKV